MPHRTIISIGSVTIFFSDVSMALQRVALSKSQSNGLLRWAGSKRKLLHMIKRFVPASFGRYVEPFAGSACLFFSLRPSRAILSDINIELIDFYHCIQKHSLAVYQLASTYPKTKQQYTYLRELNVHNMNQIERAARFFFLNRLCFNGLYRTNRLGEFNVPMGVKTGQFPAQELFINASAVLKKAIIYCSDFEEVLSRATTGDFVYLDPPYYSPRKRRRNEYGNNCFTTHDMPRLINAVGKLNKQGIPFVLSFERDDDVIKMLKQYNIHQVQVHRCISGFVQQRGTSHEIIVTNQKLEMDFTYD